MPRYDYRCDGCGVVTEICHAMAEVGFHRYCEDEECRYRLRRIFQPVNFNTIYKNQSPKNTRILGSNTGEGPLVRRSFSPGYKSALARFPNDPKAVVSTKAEALRRARELGKRVTFNPDDVLPPD